MRTPQRRIDPGVIAASHAAPQRYEFFQLVRLHELALCSSGAADSVSERIRFRSSLQLGFVPSQVEGIATCYRPGPGGQPGSELESVHIAPAFIGMLGIHGSLPLHYTEQILLRDRKLRELDKRLPNGEQREGEAQAFLDLFTNLSVGHFYRAWKKYRLPVQYELDRHNRFLPLLLALNGLGFDALRGRMSAAPGALQDESIAHLAGLLRQRPLSAEALRRGLSDYFRVPIGIEQFVGRWYAIPPEQRAMLGQANMRLGENCLVGERIWQRNLRVRIHIGPLDSASYLQFLPSGELAAALSKILSLLTGGQFEYEICLILRSAAVQPTRLDSATPQRLGYDSFLLTHAASADRRDIRYLATFTH